MNSEKTFLAFVRATSRDSGLPFFQEFDSLPYQKGRLYLLPTFLPLSLFYYSHPLTS